MFSQSAEFSPNSSRILPVVAYAGGLSMASKRTEIAIEKIIAACDGNVHGALEALLLVNDAVREIVLPGIAAHVLERQDGDRGLVRQSRRRFQRPRCGGAAAGIEQQTIDMYGLDNVLEGLRAEILDLEGDLAARVIENGLRYADAARLC